jgi:hypothetical protein
MGKTEETLWQLPKKNTSPPPQPIEQYAKRFRKDNIGKWITFLHPTHGKVPGRCIGIAFSGYSDPGRIPDFKLNVEGQSKTKRNVIQISLVDSRAQFHDSKQQAIEESKT